VDAINAIQDRGERQAVVNTVMNFRVPQNAGNFLSRVTEELCACDEGLRSMEC